MRQTMRNPAPWPPRRRSGTQRVLRSTSTVFSRGACPTASRVHPATKRPAAPPSIPRRDTFTTVIRAPPFRCRALGRAPARPTPCSRTSRVRAHAHRQLLLRWPFRSLLAAMARLRSWHVLARTLSNSRRRGLIVVTTRPMFRAPYAVARTRCPLRPPSRHGTHCRQPLRRGSGHPPRRSRPIATSANVWTNSPPSADFTRSCRDSGVSPGRTGTSRWESSAPWSYSSSTK